MGVIWSMQSEKYNVNGKQIYLFMYGTESGLIIVRWYYARPSPAGYIDTHFEESVLEQLLD